MNAIANPALPSVSEVISQIKTMECRRDGHLNFLEMFLITIPEPAKVPENDDHIESLYERVVRAMHPCEQCMQEVDQLPDVPLDWCVVH